MRKITIGALLLGLAFVLPLTIRADQDRDHADQDRDHNERNERNRGDNDHHRHNVQTPVGLIGVIPIPGNPITSADIGWVDPGTERYYIADRANAGVDLIDAESNFYVGRVGGMVGVVPATPGGTATTNGPGPNGVLVTPNRKLWAGDGNSMVRVADVDPESPNYLNIIGSISTSIPACDDGTATGHYCGRADELGYDPRDHVIMIANNAPRTLAAGHAITNPYATFISSISPYGVLGHVTFPGATGLEQPLWDPELRRFWITVPGPAGGNPSVARVNPITMMVDKTYTFDCVALTGAASVSTTGVALGPFQHLLVSACGKPIILSALTGHVFRVITQVGGGDEVWYNPGDGRFYVTGLSTVAPLVQSLGVIDAETSTWLQNVPDVRGKNPASFAENNHTFTVVQINAAIVAAPETDDSACTQFGIRGRGCIAVFAHAGGGGDGDDDK
jgi:hypothetical protein